MRLVHRLRLVLLPLLAVVTALVGVPALEATATAGDLTLTGPAAPVRAGSTQTFTATWAPGGMPTPGVTVTLTEPGGATQTQDTDGQGHANFSATVPGGESTYTVTAAGESASAVVTGRLASTLTLTGPPGLVLGTRTLQVAWSTSDGAPVSGEVTLFRRPSATAAWVQDATLTTDGAGLGSLDVPPRSAYAWRAVGSEDEGRESATSEVLEITRVPSAGLPVAAPRPVWTPAQGGGYGLGANAVVTTIPDAVWAGMVWRSWHRGCPVGRSSLRLLRINYWGYDGLRYRGEMVLNAAVVYRASGALTAMYDQGFPIRRMYRVDRFGWSRKLRGANDYASMRADNTSGFNCRSVVNKPWVRSPHASGRSIDLNTWENPYRSRTGLVPNSWWARYSHPLVAWRTSTHPVVQIWRAWGFRWTYGTGDSQHVDGRSTTTVSGTFSG